MQIIISESTDPFFNLAAEEYLLKNYTDEILFLYINSPSVIIGKHQNLLAEINYRFVYENHITIARRITGGGTVYHDEGNLNFAFFSYAPEGKQINFKKYLDIVKLVLKKFDIPAVIEGKNDLKVKGLKISGNAGHVFKYVTLHHGTLLIQADLFKLSQSLQTFENRYFYKGVKSIRSKVTNLKEICPQININKVIESFLEVLSVPITSFKPIEIFTIQNLKNTKFTSFSWIWGYSPPYLFENTCNELGKIKINVNKGIIQHAEIESRKEWNSSLISLPHDYPNIASFLEQRGENPNLAWYFF